MSASPFNAVYRRITRVTSAQLLALNATPQTVVPAPGAGLAVLPMFVMAYKPAGTAYAGIAAGEDIAFKYTDDSGAVCAQQLETTGFLDQTTAEFRVAGGLVTAVEPVANAPVVVHLLAGEITTGDTELLVRVDYSVVPVVLTLPADYTSL